MLQQVHVAAAVISVVGFFVRGIWMLADSAMLRHRWVRVAPHVVDTILLASAIALALRLGQYPLAQAWLTAKVAALIAYIGLGVVALRPGRPRGVRALAWVAALVTFGYIVAVALTRDPWPL